MNNFLKTTILLVGLTLLFMWFGSLVGGQRGMLMAFIMACCLNFGAYWFSDTIVLRLNRATEISEEAVPELYQIVRELTQKAGLPMPKVYLIASASPNAFATGRNPKHAAVAASKGLIEMLNYEEIKGVIGHELAHVEHRDILISSIAATLAGAIGMLASMTKWSMMLGGSRRGGRSQTNPIELLVIALVMPIAATIIRMAVSRSREYEADKRGAELCGEPLYLASALKKISGGAARIPMQDASPTTAHVFIMNPLKGGGINSLFSTHPPMEDRIARLEAMSRN